MLLLLYENYTIRGETNSPLHSPLTDPLFTPDLSADPLIASVYTSSTKVMAEDKEFKKDVDRGSILLFSNITVGCRRYFGSDTDDVSLTIADAEE